MIDNKKISSPKRAVLIDFMCTSPYGHNPNSLLYYHDVLRQYYDDVYCLVSKHFPNSFTFPKNTFRTLSFPYYEFRQLYLQDRQQTPANRFRHRFQMRRKTVWRLIYRTTGWDLFLAEAARSIASTLRSIRIGPKDLIFMPSVDHYGGLALLTHLSRMNRTQWPSVHLRFLNVMEGASSTSNHPRADLIRVIRKLVANGYPIKLYAETNPLASLLRKASGLDVAVAPFPPLKPAQYRSAPRDDNRLICLSPGQGRADKGFFRLLNIADLAQKLSPSLNFRAQDMNVGDSYYSPTYSETLRRRPNFTLLPSTLTNDDLVKEYQNADVVIMPYDPGTYGLRGSAILIEAISYLVPVVASYDCGFSSDISKYKSGLLAQSDGEFANALVSLLSCSDRTKTMLGAYQGYEAVFNESMQSLIGNDCQRHG